MPTARRTLPDWVTLPERFAAKLVDGKATLQLAATVDGVWAWEIRERTNMGKRRVVAVPASGPVKYGDLVDVDPASLVPGAEPQPIWDVNLEAEIEARAAADADLQEQIDAGGATSWDTITGKPATFPPTLPVAQADVTGLPAAIDGKANSADVYDKITSDGRYATTSQGTKADSAVQPAALASAVANKADLSGPGGTVPSSQLPSYVDDVLLFDSLPAFPTVGDDGKIYVAKDTNKQYRWPGTAPYTVISDSIALGETASTAYAGNRGKVAYDHSQITGNPHGLTKADLGLENAQNTSDADKQISTAAATALSSKVAKPVVPDASKAPVVYGNSLADERNGGVVPSIVPTAAEMWPNRVATALGLPAPRNYAVGGTRSLDLLFGLLSPNAAPGCSAPRTGAQWAGAAANADALVFIEDMGNDISHFLGASVPVAITGAGGDRYLAAMQNIREAIYAILSSEAVTQIQTGASGVTFGSGWSDKNYDVPYVRGGKVAYTVTNGEYVDVVVPAAKIPQTGPLAGKVFAGLIQYEPTSFGNAPVDVLVDGTLTQTWTPPAWEGNGLTLNSYGGPMVDLPVDGAQHTMRLRHAGVSGTEIMTLNALFHMSVSPPIIFAKDGSSGIRVGTYVPTPAALSTWNKNRDLVTAQATRAVEKFPNVHWVETNAPSGLTSADGLHPGSAGMQRHALDTLDVVRRELLQTQTGSRDRTNKLLNRKADLAAGLLPVSQLPATVIGKALLSATDAAAERTVLGLGNVTNLAAADLPVSTATQTALDAKGAKLTFTGPGVPYRSSGTGEANASKAIGTGSGELVQRDATGGVALSADPSLSNQATRKSWVDTQLATLKSGLTKTDVGLSSVDNVSDAPAKVAGRWYSLGTNSAGTNNALGNTTLRAYPVVLKKTTTIDRLSIAVTAAGQTGSTVRVGIYADDGTGYPGALVAGSEQVLAADAIANPAATVALTLPPGIYWFAGVVQNAATTQPTLAVVNNQPPFDLAITAGTTPPGNVTASGYTIPTQAGALPSTWSSTISTVGAAPRIYYRAA